LAKITIKNTDINYSWENREINFVSQQKRWQIFHLRAKEND
jgi:hypothetical protein